MLAWMLFLTVIAGYAICTLVTARVAYGIHRGRLIAQESRNPTDEDPIAHFEAYDRPGAASTAFVLGLLWPLTAPAYCAYRCAAFVIMTRPRVTPYEQEARIAYARRRIRQLEESLDITDPDLSPRPEEAADRT